MKILGDTSKVATTLQEAKTAIDSVTQFEKKNSFLREFRSIKTLKKKQVDDEKFEINLPTLKPNLEISCASDAVKIEFNEKYGRHLLATRKIETAEILIIEDIYYGFLNNWYLCFMYCSHCLKLAMTSIPCDSCSFVSYCSEECKTMAWEKYHDIECKVRLLIEADEDYDPISMKRFSYDIRIFIKAIKEEGIPNIFSIVKDVDGCTNKRIKGFSENNKFETDKFSAVYSLSYNEKSSDLKLLKKQFSLLMTCLKSMKCEIFKDVEENSEIYHNLEKLFVKLSFISYTNVFEQSLVSQGESCICNYDIKPETGTHRKDCMKHRGGHLAPCSSLINHSCHPNVNQFIFNGKIVTYSCRPIKENEQLFKSYKPNIMHTKTERKKVLQKYCFTCDCLACEANWYASMDKISKFEKTLEMTIRKDPSLRDYFFEFEKLNNSLLNPNVISKVKSEKRVAMLKILPKIIDAAYNNFSEEKAAYASYDYQLLLACLYQDLYLGEMEIKKYQ